MPRLWTHGTVFIGDNVNLQTPKPPVYVPARGGGGGAQRPSAGLCSDAVPAFLPGPRGYRFEEIFL